MKESLATDPPRRRPLSPIGHLPGTPAHKILTAAGNCSSILPPTPGSYQHQVEKLAIVYATPPLSPPAQRTALDPSLATLKGRSTGMDNNDRRTRQSNTSNFTAQQSRGLIETSPQYPNSSASGRFRQSQLVAQSSTAAPSAGRSGNIQQGFNYPYSEGAGASFTAETPMQSASLQYAGATPAADYAQESNPRQPQAPQQQATAAAQQYQQYGMYNVPQQQATPPSPYESVQPYQPRQSGAIEVLSNQFGVPQNYYVGSEGGPTSAPTAGIGAQNVQPQFSSAMSYTSQSPGGRDSLVSSYASGMTEPAQVTSSQGAFGQNTDYASQTAAELDNAYGSYQNELRRTFESVRDGNLAAAGNSLIRVSDWLLGNAEALGLVRDDESMHAERLKLWNEFNMCWLAVLQRQKEFTMEMLDTGQRRHPPQTLMEFDQMEAMGKELVRLCDNMEKHGLVDYQMGVWEEEIMTVLTHCLDLLEKPPTPPATAVVPHPPASRRR